LAPEVTLALQRALARTGDHEAITQLLHLIQSNSGVKAITVIDAIAELKSADIAPLLVRISQNALAPAGVRLAAVEALLQVDGLVRHRCAFRRMRF
jgi:HEAT repeat protein